MKTTYVLRILSLACGSLLTLNALILTFSYEDIFSQLISGLKISTHQSVLVLLTMILLVARLILQRTHFSTMQFAMLFFALVCLIDEWVMHQHGSLPLSRIITTWAHQPLPNNWLELKAQWRLILYWRCALIVGSFVLIVGCDMFKRKQRSYQGVAVAA